jgi:hypothetical protein
MGRFRRLRVRLRRAAQVCSNFFGFVFFERAGVSLFLGDSDNREHIQNGFALDFQFSCEIVDSNLTHPPFPVLRVLTRSSLRPHGVSLLALAGHVYTVVYARCHYSVDSGAGCSDSVCDSAPAASDSSAAAACVFSDSLTVDSVAASAAPSADSAEPSAATASPARLAK